MVKNARDAPQQLQINVLLSENLINIRTGTAQLAGEPCDGTSLFVKYAFYKLTGMKHNCYGTKTNINIQKERGNLTFARSVFQGLRNALLLETSNAESPRRTYIHFPPFSFP